MVNQGDLKVWIEGNFPKLWQLLNAKAKRRLPTGLIEYLGRGCPSEIEAGREHISSIERYLTDLVNVCGWQEVANKYRRDLSGVNSENQVAELFCEIALCASLGRCAKKLELRPPTGKGTYSDCLFNLNGFDIYGEAKRYVDPWPHIERIGDSSNKKIPYNRSISKTPSGAKPDDSARPRSMDLRGKLRDVHRQLPDGTLNVLFVFHSSLGQSKRYLTQALFGDSNFSETDSGFILQGDGLFSLDDWQNISACCLCRVNPDSKVDFTFFWKNPRANIELPEPVYTELKA